MNIQQQPLQQQKKKPVEFHFVDMNDPERYKKLKVARACDFCRRRKSKCDIGIPGSGTCSNCQKHQMVCIFSPVTTTTTSTATVTTPLQTPSSATFYIPPVVDTREEQDIMTPLLNLSYFEQQQQQPLEKFPLLVIQDGQVGYEKCCSYANSDTSIPPQINSTTLQRRQEPSFGLETKLFQLYFNHVHSAYPLLLKTCIMNIHSQDRLLLSTSLRYAILALACHYYPSFALQEKEEFDSNYFFQIAQLELDLKSIRLDTVQYLLLLYKYQEITCSSPLQSSWYLERAQEMIGQLNSSMIIPQQQEMINRAKWILFGCIALSNLSNPIMLSLYKKVDLLLELPQPLQEEHGEAIHHVNRFAQIANLSVLYSHTVVSMMENHQNLIDLNQFKEIRQHWHNSLHPITQSRLHCANEQEEIDILILYSAVLYDMLYLLLLSHYSKQESEEEDRKEEQEKEKREGIETSFRLLRMVHTWVTRHCFTVAVQSKRMACFALMLCLQANSQGLNSDFILQIQDIIKLIQFDSRIDQELDSLYTCLAPKSVTTPNVTQQQQVDYFSLIPLQSNNNRTPIITTPGLWSDAGGLTTPIREETEEYNNFNRETLEWILQQQVQNNQQFQLYQQQQQQHQQQYQHSNINTPLLTTATNHTQQQEDYFPSSSSSWTTMDQLNYLKLDSNSNSDYVFTLQHPHFPPQQQNE